MSVATYDCPTSTESFEIVLQNERLILRGDLDKSPQVLARCRHVLETVPKFSRLFVEAYDARVTPEGVETWIAAVDHFLMGCELIYAPSQLGVILQYDDRYRHQKSSYQDYLRPATTSKAAD
jgi:hypothetical protein